ncbi:selenium metabolism-associated LysR family transcriptional regulator [Thermocrinis sp.]
MRDIDVDLRLLELFCCVYEKQGVSKSSECLHLSQSTISFHIHQLERQIGMKLFYRKGKRLIPTSTAQMLYPYAKKILELKLAVIEEVKLLSGSYRGIIKLGSSSVPGSYILPEIVSDFLSKNPQTTLELYVSDSGDVLEKIKEGSLDLGVVGARAGFSELRYEALWKDHICIVGGVNFGKRLSVEDLKKLPWILREEGSGTRKLLEEALLKYGISFRDIEVLMITDRNEVIVEVLRKTKAVSFLSSLALRKYRDIKRLNVEGFEPIEREFYLVYDENRPLTPAVRYFMEEIKKYSFAQVFP